MEVHYPPTAVGEFLNLAVVGWVFLIANITSS